MQVKGVGSRPQRAVD